MIFHILKNGQQVEDIEGYNVDLPTYYELVERISRERRADERSTRRTDETLRGVVHDEKPLSMPHE